jgi:hypothetical protein
MLKKRKNRHVFNTGNSFIKDLPIKDSNRYNENDVPFSQENHLTMGLKLGPAETKLQKRIKTPHSYSQ